MKSFRMRKNHIRFVSQEQENNFAGISIYLPYRDEAFVEIVREHTINDIITTIHEYAHLTSYSINIFNKLSPNFYYTEIISLFFELIGADFLGTQFGIDKSTILKAENHNTMSEFADITSYKIDLITFESLFLQGYTKNKDIKLIGRDFLNLSSEKVNYLFKNENIEISDYVIGYIIALELYYIYLEDKEKAMFILKKMLLYSAKSKLDYYNNIKKLGIIPNQHIEKYVTTLKSDVLKLSRN